MEKKQGEIICTKRALNKIFKNIVFLISLLFSVLNVAILIYFPISTWTHLAICLGYAICMIFILYKGPFESTAPSIFHIALDFVLILAAISSVLYYSLEHNEMLFRVSVFPTFQDIFFSGLLIITVLEATRRASSGMLSVVCIFFLLYAFWGHLLPGELGHSGFSFNRIVTYMSGDNGIWGVGIAAASSVVFLFVLFGEFLNKFGGGEVFIELAMSLAGQFRGGPAKVAVLSSALFGTISGSSIANVAATGSFTIPLMKKNGYRPEFAGGIVSASSTGGQIMPPVMGATAFVMAEIIGVSYASLAIKALVPACLFYFAILVMIDCESARLNLLGLSKASLPKAKDVLFRKGIYLLPIVVIFVSLLIFNVSTNMSALYGIVACLLVPFFSKATQVTKKNFFDALVGGGLGIVSIIAACAAAGLVVGVLAMTGLGMKIASMLIRVSEGNLVLLLIATMLLSILLGMGLSTLPAYIIAASVVAPILTGAGVPLLTSHLFVFYYAILAVVTPPVALASYAAAGIANANISKVGFEGFKLALAGMIVPFIFVYSPELLLEGTPFSVVISIITALIGVLFLGCVLQGYLFGKLGLIQRILLFIAALLSIFSGFFTDILGIGIAGMALSLTATTRHGLVSYFQSLLKFVQHEIVK
ncbi:TRAP transporter permease [Aminobacterium colombiense]